MKNKGILSTVNSANKEACRGKIVREHNVRTQKRVNWIGVAGPL